MFFIKKLVILSGDNSNNSNGVVKLERVGKEISCDVKLFFRTNSLYLAIMENEKMIYCGDAYSFKEVLAIDSKLSGDIKVIVFDDSHIYSKGSTKGSMVSFEYIWQVAKRLIKSTVNEQNSLFESNENIEDDTQIDYDNNPKENKSNIVEQKDVVTIQAENAKDNNKNIVEEEKLATLTNSHHKGADNSANQQNNEKIDININDQQSSVNVSENTHINLTQNETDIETAKDNAQTKTAKPQANKMDNIIRQGKRYNKESDFYNHIQKKLDDLMSSYPKDDELEALMPSSKWIRVATENEDYYVVGIIYDEDTPKLICYGVPDVDNSNPPKCRSDARQWLELEKNSRGYWMMYQDAETGKTLTATTL